MQGIPVHEYFGLCIKIRLFIFFFWLIFSKLFTISENPNAFYGGISIWRVFVKIFRKIKKKPTTNGGFFFWFLGDLGYEVGGWGGKRRKLTPLPARRVSLRIVFWSHYCFRPINEITSSSTILSTSTSQLRLWQSREAYAPVVRTNY